jgi:hypothetical protein
MKNSTLLNKLKAGLFSTVIVLSAIAGSVTGTKAQVVKKAQTVKNVVLVHGAFADGSGW